MPPPSLPKASLLSFKFPPFLDPLTQTNFSTTPTPAWSPAISQQHIAHAFFIHHGHVIVYHDFHNLMAFQDLYLSAYIGYISSIPVGPLAEDHHILESQQHAIFCASASQAMVPAQPPPHVTPPSSLLDCYVVKGFARPPTNPPLTSATSSSSNPPSRAGSAPPVGYHGGRLLSPHPPDVQVQHPLLPLTFVMGGGSNLSNYTTFEQGASLVDVTSYWLANTAHSSHRLSSSSNPPFRTGSGLIWCPPCK